MSEYLLAHAPECCVCSQNKILNSPELKLEVVGSLLMWVLGYELRYCARVRPALNHWTSSPPLCLLLVHDQLEHNLLFEYHKLGLFNILWVREKNVFHCWGEHLISTGTLDALILFSLYKISTTSMLLDNNSRFLSSSHMFNKIFLFSASLWNPASL